MRSINFATAAAAVGIGALLAAACGSGGHHSAVPLTGSSSTTTGPSGGLVVAPSTSAPAQMVSSGQVGQRSDVPWSLVGPGWMLAEWAPTVAQHSGDITLGNPAGTVLFLVDPLGGRYVLATGTSVPTGELTDWSGDAKRALFWTYFGGGANPEVSVFDLTSASTTSSFQVPDIGTSADFTAPNGLAILTKGTGVTIPARRLDLNGAPQFTFPSSYQQSGPVYDGSESPDGTELAFDAGIGSAGVVLVSNAGQFDRYVPIPVAGLCFTLRWWSTSQVLVRCGPDGGTLLWLVPTDGSSPTRLTLGTDAWQLLNGVYSTTGRCHMDTCTFGVLSLQSDGTQAPVAVPSQWSSNLDIGAIGGFENRLAVFAPPFSPSGSGDQPAGFVSWFDPETGVVTPLLGGSVNGGSVNAALMRENPAT